MTTQPPLLLHPCPSPDDTATLPPLPLLVTPTPMDTEPDVAPLDDPVDKLTDPDSPNPAQPVCMVRDPLGPPSLSADANDTFPLEPAPPLPLIKLSEPPADCLLVPALIFTLPPAEAELVLTPP